MSKKVKQKGGIIRKKEGPKEKWYYDACTLDKSKKTYSEIVNSQSYRVSIVSHLSLGEAYANCREKGKEEFESFSSLINILEKYIKVVGNDASQGILDGIRQVFQELEITDSVHLATAIDNKCQVLRTNDRICGA